MKQQVNLYKYLPSEDEWKIRPHKVYFIYFFLFVLLAINFSYAWWKYHRQNQQLQLVSAQLKAEEKQLADLTKQYPMIDAKDLTGTVQQLKKQLNQRLKLAALFAQNQGFSLFLKKLIHSILPTVWLNEISIANNDQKIILKGFSIQVINIQLFLDKLNRLSSYNDYLIELQNVTKIKNQKNFVFLSFEASNKTTVNPS